MEKAECLRTYFAPVFCVEENDSQTEKGKNKCCFKVAETIPRLVKGLITEHLAIWRVLTFGLYIAGCPGDLKKKGVGGDALCLVLPLSRSRRGGELEARR